MAYIFKSAGELFRLDSQIPADCFNRTLWIVAQLFWCCCRAAGCHAHCHHKNYASMHCHMVPCFTKFNRDCFQFKNKRFRAWAQQAIWHSSCLLTFQPNTPRHLHAKTSFPQGAGDSLSQSLSPLSTPNDPCWSVPVCLRSHRSFSVWANPSE